MWSKMTGKGEQLPDLLVVLAITVVLAAILLPAVSNYHGNEVNAESGFTAVGPTMDGHVRPASRSISGRDAREGRDVAAGSQEESVVVERDYAVTEEEYVPFVSTVERDGLEQIRTTDISYVIP